MSKVYRMRRITTAQAAAVMGCDPLFVREMMRREKLPIGIAEKKEDSKRTTFFISPKLLADYLGITVDQLWEMLPEEESEE